MLNEIYQLSQHFLQINNRKYKRYFLKRVNLNHRLSLIIGQRGIGKTTAIVQYLLAKYKNNIFTKKALYLQADHFLIRQRTLYEIAEEFYLNGGELLCIDEIHKYPTWSLELKSIYDTFPKLKVIASGSSILEISKGSHDLSRRAIVYKMFGMSFREFIELTLDIQMEFYAIKDIINNHQKIAEGIINLIENKRRKILSLFSDYLEYGYYPFFLEFKDKSLFHIALEQNIHTTLESDLISIHPSLSGNSIKKIQRLLSIISANVPFIPDLRKLKTTLEIGDERTLKIYLRYLEDAGIVHLLSKKSGSLAQLEKPEKIFLNNSNLINAIAPKESGNIGNIRETFFINQLSSFYTVDFSKLGDFLIDRKNIFEVGGKNKNYNQIRNIKDSYLAVDNIEIGVGNKIPLYLFGFLY